MNKLKFTNTIIENLDACVGLDGKVSLQKFIDLTDKMYDNMLICSDTQDIYLRELSKIEWVEQAQFSTDFQLHILKQFANKLGLYDASDYIKSN